MHPWLLATTPTPLIPSGVTSRTLNETSGTSIIPAGSPFRFGLGLRQGDVPPGGSIALSDGADNALTAQFDAINYWPNGSVRYCEVRGYTARSIAAGGHDTISVSSVVGPFNNTLPGGKTPSQLLTDLTVFSGAQDLIIECDSMASASGASNVYTTGNWLAHFNTLLSGSYVQQINKGRCCMGFRAWGQLTNGSINHVHIHVAVYVWLWLNTSTGAIRDVEYLVYLHNSLLNKSTDGTSYLTFVPDRYNYNPVLKNGATVIVNNSDPSMLLHVGSPSTIGGHSLRGGWFTARNDGKPRWIAGTVEAQNLLVTCDPVQSNPQSTATSRSYLLSTGLIPKYDLTTNATDPPSGLTPILYAPMVKGFWTNEVFSDWDTQVNINQGGSHPHIGMIPDWNVRDLLLQTKTTAQNHRISALGWATAPAMNLDTNGRVPNFRNIDYTGMTPNQPLTYNNGFWWNNFVLGPTDILAYGDWVGITDTTHYPSGAYYTYLMEGGAHNRDVVLMGATEALMCRVPDFALLQAAYGGWPPPPNGNSGGPSVNADDRTPLIGSTRYYGNVIVSVSTRNNAWALRELVFAAGILPAALADGTAFGEAAYFKDCLKDTMNYGAEYVSTVLSANEVNNGFWHFDAFNGGSGLNSIMISQTGTSDPWMQSYHAEAFARAKLIHGNEPSFGAACTTMCTFHARYFTGGMNTNCSILASAQSINLKNGGGNTTFKADWGHVGTFVFQVSAPDGGGIYMFANFSDTSTGWITLTTASGNPSWPECPFGVGATLIFTSDYFNGLAGGTPAPSPFVMETQTYYVVAAEPANSRIKVSTTSGGTAVIPNSTATTVLWNILNITSCPATYVPFDNATVTAAYLGYGGADANMANLLRAIRTFRTAGPDTVALQAADATATARIAFLPGLAGFGPWPMGKVVV